MSLKAIPGWRDGSLRCLDAALRCRNVIDASFRAMIRDARKIDYLVDRDVFEALIWPRLQTKKPDPFTEKERDKILAQFQLKSPFYYPGFTRCSLPA
jgi:hypothetical protein